MRRTLAALVIASLVPLSACYTAGVESPIARASRYDDVGVSWFWGISNSVSDAQQCRKGLAEVETWFPWYTYIVAPLTIGIVTPIKKAWTCAE
jgi:hypothetical protein